MHCDTHVMYNIIVPLLPLVVVLNNRETNNRFGCLLSTMYGTPRPNFVDFLIG